MSMPAIERVIPLVGHLPVSIRDAMRNATPTLTIDGLALFGGVAVGAASDGVQLSGTAVA